MTPSEAPAVIARRIVRETLREIARDETRPAAHRQAAAAELADRTRAAVTLLVDTVRSVVHAFATLGEVFTAVARPLNSSQRKETP